MNSDCFKSIVDLKEKAQLNQMGLKIFFCLISVNLFWSHLAANLNIGRLDKMTAGLELDEMSSKFG